MSLLTEATPSEKLAAETCNVDNLRRPQRWELSVKTAREFVGRLAKPLGAVTARREVDLALNDSKIAKPLSIFGGESAQFRQRVASERVELMESEKDLIEAIARAKTKQEKEELQKQLDELRKFRRELEKSLK